jgi:hypothetical protein
VVGFNLLCAASLVVLGKSLIEGPQISFSGGVPKFFSRIFAGLQPSKSILCTGLG